MASIPSTNPSTKSPSIHITPALPTDASTLAALHYKSFSSDTGLQTSSFPSNRPLTASEESEYLAWRTARLGARIEREDYLVFKAVDQAKGAVVGCVALNFPRSSASRKKDGVGRGGGEKDGAESVEKPKAPRYDGAPSFLDMTVFSEMEAKASAAHEKHIGEEREMWYVQGLFVDPSYQGHRIGSRLLQHGLELVDRDGLECYLEASPEGAGVYRRLGFEVVEEMKLAGGKFCVQFMIRKAKQAEAS